MALHLAALLVLSRMLLHALPPATQPLPMTMVFARPVAAARQAAPPVAVPALPGPPAMPSPPAAAATRRTTAVPRPKTLQHATAQRERPNVAQPVAQRPLPTPPAAQAPAVQPAPDAAWLAGFTARVQAAVQQAAVYPPLARRMRVQGRVCVRFDYSSGLVSSVQVATPGPSPLLDRAAVSAVRHAAYPGAPAAFANRRLPMVVWVAFVLQTDG